jgi:triacylglycerol lipase
MTEIAPTIECRMLCASGCAYGIDASGKYTAPSPFTEGVGWDGNHPPVVIFGGESHGQHGAIYINACLVGKNQDGIVIAFRGTLPPEPVTVASMLDWWQDIIDSRPAQEGSLPGKVHHGFWDAVQTLWPQIATAVADFRGLYPSAKLYLTGHSKGGPMATISAARAYFDDQALGQPAAVYTFASPHPGDTDFVNGFPLSTIPVTRYENYLDIVPFLPPTEAFIELAEKIPLVGDLFKIAEGWDYAPLGALQYIKEDHAIIGDDPLLESIRLAELVEALLKWESGFKEIADAHSHLCGAGYMSGTCPTGVCG